MFGATEPNEGVVFERVAGDAESMENLETSEPNTFKHRNPAGRVQSNWVGSWTNK